MFGDRKNNLNAKLNRLCVTGWQTPIQALLDELASDQFYCALECSYDGSMKQLFFAHVDSDARQTVEISALDRLFLQDNRFRLPLLHFVGRTNLSTSFSISFAFLSREAELDYVWALKDVNQLYVNDALPTVVVYNADASLVAALSRVSPGSRHLLCFWPIQKNVLVQERLYLKNKTGLRPSCRCGPDFVWPAHVTSYKYAGITFLPRFQMFRQCASILLRHDLCAKRSSPQHGLAMAHISVIY